MLRRLCCAFCALVVTAGVVLADEVKGTIKSTDGDKNTVTVTVNGKDQVFSVMKDAKIYTIAKGKKGKKDTEVNLGEVGLIKNGAGVTLTTDKVNGKAVVTTIKVDAETKKKKKN